MEDSVYFAAMSSRVYFHYIISLSINMHWCRTVKGTASFSNCFIHWFIIFMSGWFWFCCSGRIPRLSLNQRSLCLEWLRNLLLHHSQVSSMERWSRNTLRVVTASVLRPQWGFNVPLYFK